MRVKMMVVQHTSEIGAVEHRCGVALKSLNEEGNQEMFNYQLAIVFIGSTRQINVKSSSGCNFFSLFLSLTYNDDAGRDCFKDSDSVS